LIGSLNEDGLLGGGGYLHGRCYGLLLSTFFSRVERVSDRSLIKLNSDM